MTDLTAGSAPATPELVAAADGCGIRLNIHDLSENEEGFTLYRQTTESPDWVHAADLASHPGKGWLEYQESNLTGGVTYYVAAFNSQGESSSNLALVNIDPQACPPSVPLIEIPALHLKVGELKIDENTGGIYCYTSLDSKNWSRWPEHGSLNSSASLQEIPPLVKPHLLSNLKDKGFETETKTLELNMECWGWQGPNLIAIGNIKDKIDIAAPQEIHLVLSGATFDILPKISLDIKSKLFELGSSLQTPSIKVVDQYSVETLGYVPESDQMPYIVAWESDDPGICADHMLDPAGKELFCSPLPGFTAGPGGSYPQKYLVWYVLNGAALHTRRKNAFHWTGGRILPNTTRILMIPGFTLW